MKVLDGLASSALGQVGCAATIGNFDGVHRGHRAIIDEARRRGAALSLPTVVVTFEPHPVSILAPGKAPQRLTTPARKLELLAGTGVDFTTVVRSDAALLALSPEEFVRRLVEAIRPRHLVEGASFRFGHQRTGTPDRLRGLGETHGFGVTVVDLLRVTIPNGSTLEVSSSAIRRMILAGQVEQATLALGRRYRLSGLVVGGSHRGASLGYPTANLAVDEQLVPGDGVYAGFAALEPAAGRVSERYACAISIGTTPTFTKPGETPARKIEAFLLDTRMDLHGRHVHLEFGAWLRSQRKFDGPDALVTQIGADVEQVRRFTGAPRSPSAERAGSPAS